MDPRLPVFRGERKRDAEAETRRALHAAAAKACYGDVTRHLQDELGSKNSMRFLEEVASGEKCGPAELLERQMVISLAQSRKSPEQALAPLFLLCRRFAGRFVADEEASERAQLGELTAVANRECSQVVDAVLRRGLDADGLTTVDALLLVEECDEALAALAAIRARASEKLAAAKSTTTEGSPS